MKEKDTKYLNQMLEAAEDAVAFVRNKTRDALDDDKQLTLSVLKSLEMLGSSASKVSKECQNDCEPVPWDNVIEMKQQVVHTYWDIDRDWIWEKVTTDLPLIIDAIKVLLSK